MQSRFFLKRSIKQTRFTDIHIFEPSASACKRYSRDPPALQAATAVAEAIGEIFPWDITTAPCTIPHSSLLCKRRKALVCTQAPASYRVSREVV